MDKDKVKVTVITDSNGKFLGAVRTGPTPDGKITVRVHPRADHKHHNIEVDEAVMSRPIEELHKELQRQVSRKA